LIKKQTDKIISTNNLNFKFEESSEALSLKNINLNINKGDMIGIIGKSGSGKTTLINILLGLLKPTKGEVIYYANPDTFNIGHVPQDIVIFDDTLQNNIAFGVREKDIN
jgi:ABC-type bacteriocin/lantibiotic exporter with double-glycine peptidase domain